MQKLPAFVLNSGYSPANVFKLLLQIAEIAGKLAHVSNAGKLLLEVVFEIVQLLYQLFTVTAQQPGSRNKLFGERITGNPSIVSMTSGGRRSVLTVVAKPTHIPSTATSGLFYEAFFIWQRAAVP